MAGAQDDDGLFEPLCGVWADNHPPHPRRLCPALRTGRLRPPRASHPGPDACDALIQHATRDQLTSDQLATTARTAADALTHIWPEIDRDPTHTQLLHANTTALTSNTGDALPPPDAHLLFLAAHSLGKAGQVTAAAFEQLLDDYPQVLGPDHPDTLTNRHNLAYWHERASG